MGAAQVPPACYPYPTFRHASNTAGMQSTNTHPAVHMYVQHVQHLEGAFFAVRTRAPTHPHTLTHTLLCLDREQFAKALQPCPSQQLARWPSILCRPIIMCTPQWRGGRRLPGEGIRSSRTLVVQVSWRCHDGFMFRFCCCAPRSCSYSSSSSSSASLVVIRVRTIEMAYAAARDTIGRHHGQPSLGWVEKPSRLASSGRDGRARKIRRTAQARTTRCDPNQ